MEEIIINKENIKKSLDFYLNNLSKEKKLIYPALNFVQICLENGFLNEALIIVDKIIKVQNDFWHPFFLKAKIFNRCGNHQNAITMLKKVADMKIPQKFYDEMAIETFNCGLIDESAFYLLHMDTTLHKTGQWLGEKIFNFYLKQDVDKAIKFALAFSEYFCLWEIFKLMLSHSQEKKFFDRYEIFKLLLAIRNITSKEEKKKFIDEYISKYNLPKHISFLFEILSEEKSVEFIEYVYEKKEKLFHSLDFIREFLTRFLPLQGGKVLQYFYPYCGRVKNYWPPAQIALFWFKMGELAFYFNELDKAGKYFNKFLKCSGDNLYLLFYANFFLFKFEEAFSILEKIDDKNIPLDFLCFPFDKMELNISFIKKIITKVDFYRKTRYKNYALFYKCVFMNYISKMPFKLFNSIKPSISQRWMNYGLGMLSINSGIFDIAIKHLKICYNKNPSDYKVLLKLIELIYIKNSLKGSLNFLKNYNLDDDTKTLMEGILHFYNGEYDKSISFLDKVNKQTHEIMLMKAISCLRKRDFNNAYRLLELSSSMDFFNVETFLWKCEYYFLNKDRMNLLRTLNYIEKHHKESFWVYVYRAVVSLEMQEIKELNGVLEKLKEIISKLNIRQKLAIDINFCKKLLLSPKVGRKEDPYWIIFYLNQIKDETKRN